MVSWHRSLLKPFMIIIYLFFNSPRTNSEPIELNEFTLVLVYKVLITSDFGF